MPLPGPNFVLIVLIVCSAIVVMTIARMYINMKREENFIWKTLRTRELDLQERSMEHHMRHCKSKNDYEEEYGEDFDE